MVLVDTEVKTEKGFFSSALCETTKLLSSTGFIKQIPSQKASTS